MEKFARRGGQGRHRRRSRHEAFGDLDGQRQRPVLHLAERPGHQPPRRLLGRREAPGHVGARPRHRGDERALRERPQPPRPVQRRRQRPVLRRLARLRAGGARRSQRRHERDRRRDAGTAGAPGRRRRLLRGRSPGRVRRQRDPACDGAGDSADRRHRGRHRVLHGHARRQRRSAARHRVLGTAGRRLHRRVRDLHDSAFECGPVLHDANDHIGTYVPSVRIGDVLYSTNPGEAFPEVNEAIADSVTNARSTNVVGMAGDMLGYYYQRGDYTDQEFGSSDFERFNVGPDLAQDNADLGTGKRRGARLRDDPDATVFAPHDATVEDKPGMQFYPDQVESSDPTINFYGSSAKSQDGAVDGRRRHRAGTSATARPTRPRPRSASTTRSPDPGIYDVTATVTGSNATTRSWTQTIVIDPPLAARRADLPLEQEGQPDGDRQRRSGHARLRPLDLPGRQRGQRADHQLPRDGAGSAQVTVADGAGNTATTTVHMSKAPRLEITRSPRRRRSRPAARRRSRSTSRTRAARVASGAKVCLSVKGRRRWTGLHEARRSSRRATRSPRPRP